ncbi:MAG TPA: hypothetical protein VEL76_00580 [Gemmataceae bacterium]|nr:hypothetical protein [Gemmataceae bacterium]
MRDDYADLKAAIEAAGFFTTFMPRRALARTDEPGDRIVCASHSYTRGPRKGGLGGNSFSVAKRGDTWFIVTWAPIIYRLSDPAQLAALCIRLLKRIPAKAYADFDEETKAEFGLVEVPEWD